MIRTLFQFLTAKKIRRWGERELIFNEGGEGIGGAKLLFRYVQFIPSSFPLRGIFSEMNQLRARGEEDRGGSALKNAPRGWWASWEKRNLAARIIFEFEGSLLLTSSTAEWAHSIFGCSLQTFDLCLFASIEGKRFVVLQWGGQFGRPDRRSYWAQDDRDIPFCV